jgi:histidinol phosphatase-like PHP family hydrolase
MKTYQIEIEEQIFPYFKKLMMELPLESFKLYTKEGCELKIDEPELELSDEAKRAIDEGIASLDSGKIITTEMVVNEAQARYPQLKFRK